MKIQVSIQNFKCLSRYILIFICAKHTRLPYCTVQESIKQYTLIVRDFSVFRNRIQYTFGSKMYSTYDMILMISKFLREIECLEKCIIHMISKYKKNSLTDKVYYLIGPPVCLQNGSPRPSGSIRSDFQKIQNIIILYIL